MSFASLGLSEALVDAVTQAGYTQPTPVQQRAIPAVLQGHDLMVAAQTGTGKTGGFALPVLEKLFPSGQPSAKRKPRQARALVLTPTRELAAQVHASFLDYAKKLSFTSACIYGGVGTGSQIEALAAGVDVLVACPGRLLDLIQQGRIDLGETRILTLDEADRMLDMGFIHDVKKVLARLPAQRQNLLFSATFSTDITRLANELLHNPDKIEITPANTTVEKIAQRIYKVPTPAKRQLLAQLIQQGEWRQTLVFTRTKHGANRLAEYLQKNDLPAAAIHGNKSQNARTKALADFRSGQIRVMVATDIAARGLDIDQLPHVVNFELPNIEEDYVHRIGRTGRAGNPGEAVSLVAQAEEKHLRAIERLIKQKLPVADISGFDLQLDAAEAQETAPPPRQNNHRQNARSEKRAPKARNEGQASKSGEDSARNAKGSGRNNRKRPAKPRQEQPQAEKPLLPKDRAPDEFRDDDIDNFGNRVDYVSPYQNAEKNRQGNRQRTGAAAARTKASPSRSQGKSAPRDGKPAGAPAARQATRKKSPGNNRPERRNRHRGQERLLTPSGPTMDTTSQTMSAAPKPSNRKPVILHKSTSKLDRQLNMEQLEELERKQVRQREKPSLLSSD